MPFLELLQLGIVNAGDKFWSLVVGTVPAVAVYGITKRDVSIAKQRALTAREEAKKEFTEAIAPALDKFRHELKQELLTSIEGTYLRADVSLAYFQGIRKDIARLEHLVIKANS